MADGKGYASPNRRRHDSEGNDAPKGLPEI